MGKENKNYRAFKTFIQACASYLIIVLLGYLSIYLFNNDVIKSLVIGIISSILSFVMSFIEEKIKERKTNNTW